MMQRQTKRPHAVGAFLLVACATMLVAQAPAALQKLGLEWAYRIAAEPRRLFRRYFTYNSLFLWYSLRDRMRGQTP